MPPADWDLSAHVKHLRNLYVFFWRWATWKVFGDSEGLWIPMMPPGHTEVKASTCSNLMPSTVLR
jgi:hypothetical protein